MGLNARSSSFPFLSPFRRQYNAECDSLTPLSQREIVAAVVEAERARERGIAAAGPQRVRDHYDHAGKCVPLVSC